MSTTAILRAIRFADDAPVWFPMKLLENKYTKLRPNRDNGNRNFTEPVATVWLSLNLTRVLWDLFIYFWFLFLDSLGSQTDYCKLDRQMLYPSFGCTWWTMEKKSGNLSFYLISMPLFGYRENSRKTKPKKFAWWSKPHECFHLAGWGGNERDMSILIFYSSFFSSKFFCAYWATTIWDIDLIFGCTEKDYRRRITFWVLFFQRKWKLRILTFGLLEHKFSV